MSSTISSIIAGTPRTDGAEGNRGQRATDKAGERQARSGAPRIDFAATAQDAANQNQATAEQARQAKPEAASGFPKLRRVTDGGKAAPEAIDIPTHLERRRAWREARGLNTFHAQHLAQAEETPPDTETRNAATQAYRSKGGRGRLDIDLAQRFSLTV